MTTPGERWSQLGFPATEPWQPPGDRTRPGSWPKTGTVGASTNLSADEQPVTVPAPLVRRRPAAGAVRAGVAGDLAGSPDAAPPWPARPCDRLVPPMTAREELIAVVTRRLDADEDVHAYADTDLVDERLTTVVAAVADAVLDARWRPPLPDSETEWGCRDRHGRVHSVGVENEAQARAMRSMTPVRREVGPWTEVWSR